MLIAFNNDPKLKAGLVREINKHRVQDRLVNGTYGKLSQGQAFKGCAVGCSIRSYCLLTKESLETGNHSNYEKFGIPQLLARLEDGIFEGLSRQDSKEWPVLFMSSIPVGADLPGVWPKFVQWLLVDPVHGVIRYAKTDAQKKAIQRVADLYAMSSKATKDEFREAARACRNAYAADAAADAADAAYAAYAADAAADAAYAAYAAYAADARQKARRFQAEKLLELLRAAPVKKAA